jgi:hypothetical protein
MPIPDMPAISYVVEEYTVTILNTDASDLPPRDCLGNYKTGETKAIRFIENEGRCQVTLMDYVLNLDTRKFLAAFTWGYTRSGDKGDNSPYVSGGVCTKIE